MDIDTHNDFQRTELETKAGIPLDAVVTHADMMDAFEAFNPADLVYAMNASYRQNGAFVMNRKMQSAVRKFKDTTTARRTSSPQWDGFTR